MRTQYQLVANHKSGNELEKTYREYWQALTAAINLKNAGWVVSIREVVR